MKEVFRLVRIFIASPSDLMDERRLIKETEQELNSGIANYLGFRIELKDGKTPSLLLGDRKP